MKNKLISLRHHQARNAWRDGHRCLALADEAGALDAFRSAQTFDPDLWQASLDLGRLMQQRGAREAALLILAGVVARTDAPEAHLAFASACHESGDYASAFSHYRSAAACLGDSLPNLYFDWAQAALAIDDFRQAARCLQRFQRLQPTDPRPAVLLQALPRLQEYNAQERHAAKALAYIQSGAVLLGTASDDGIDIPTLPSQPLGYTDLAVITQRFVGLSNALRWQWDGFAVGTRSIRPWVQALSRLTGHPIVDRESRQRGQRLIHVELNWCEAAATRLADTRTTTGSAWGLALGVKFGAQATAITALMAMVSVPWFRLGALSRDLADARLYLLPDEAACVPEILRQCREMHQEPSAEQIAYYHTRHPHYVARSLTHHEE
ncbi:MAG: hypothetical protein H7338_10850 [Candidatus Sericytochromatia bacterium]|nr:hypothetical protein [Candidatus Sericytochromatia bacterium]